MDVPIKWVIRLENLIVNYLNRDLWVPSTDNNLGLYAKKLASLLHDIVY